MRLTDVGVVIQSIWFEKQNTHYFLSTFLSAFQLQEHPPSYSVNSRYLQVACTILYTIYCLSWAYEVASGMTGMFDLLRARGGGTAESTGEKKKGKTIPSPMAVFNYVQVSSIMCSPFHRKSWSELISQLSAVGMFVWEWNGRGGFSEALQHSSITERQVFPWFQMWKQDSSHQHSHYMGTAVIIAGIKSEFYPWLQRFGNAMRSGFGDPQAASTETLGQSSLFCVLCRAPGLEQYPWHPLDVWMKAHHLLFLLASHPFYANILA